jgi:hypothetical protein
MEVTYYDNYDYWEKATSPNFLGIIGGERIYIGDCCLLPGISPDARDLVFLNSIHNVQVSLSCLTVTYPCSVLLGDTPF